MKKTKLTNLSLESVSIVGRLEELGWIDNRFEKQGVVVTLSGKGGSGKSKLAHVWAQTRANQFPAGVWFVDLGVAKSLEMICQDVANVLDVSLYGPNTAIQLGETFKSLSISARGPMLLILDSCQNLLEQTAAAIMTWRHLAPELHVLVTSRKALEIDLEEEIVLGDLELPTEEDIHWGKGLLEFSALRLFYQRCLDLDPDFSVTTENLKDMARICVCLQGVALAIELLAMETQYFTPDVILEKIRGRLADNETVLSDPIGFGLDGGWQLLTQEEKVALAQLSVFRSFFCEDWAHKVLLDDVSNLFEKLLKKRFLSVADFSRHDDVPMYHLHDRVQIFAYEKLKELDLQVEIELRWQTWLVDYGREIWLKYEQGGTRELIQHMRDIYENLINFACRNDVDREEAAWAIVFVSHFHARVGSLKIVKPILEKTMAAFGVVLEDLSGENPLTYVPEQEEELLHWLVVRYAVCMLQEDNKKSIEIVKLIPNTSPCFQDAQVIYAWALLNTAQSVKSIEVIQKVLENDVPYTIYLRAKNTLASAYINMGRYDEAEVHLNEMMTIAQETENEYVLDCVYGNLGNVFQGRRQYDKALEYFYLAKDIAEKFRYMSNLSVWLGNISTCYTYQGKKVEAFDKVIEALKLARVIGDHRMAIIWLAHLGECYYKFTDKFELAEQNLRNALRTMMKLGMRDREARSAGCLARILLRRAEKLGDRSQEFIEFCLGARKWFSHSSELNIKLHLKYSFENTVDWAIVENHLGNRDKTRELALKANTLLNVDAADFKNQWQEFDSGAPPCKKNNHRY